MCRVLHWTHNGYQKDRIRLGKIHNILFAMGVEIVYNYEQRDRRQGGEPNEGEWNR